MPFKTSGPGEKDREDTTGLAGSAGVHLKPFEALEMDWLIPPGTAGAWTTLAVGMEELPMMRGDIGRIARERPCASKAEDTGKAGLEFRGLARTIAASRLPPRGVPCNIP